MAWLCHTNEKPNGREISRNTATSKMTGAEGMDSADACDHLLCNATRAAPHGYGGHKSGRKGRPSTRQGPWGDVADWQCGTTSPCRGTPNTRHADKPPPTLSSTAVSSITTAPWKATCSASGAVTLWLPTSTFATEVDMGRKNKGRSEAAHLAEGRHFFFWPLPLAFVCACAWTSARRAARDTGWMRAAPAQALG